MDAPRSSRRAFLARGVTGSIGLCVLPLFGCGEGAPVCLDPELLSTPERALRDGQAYVDASPHGPDKTCAGCRFFHDEGGGCGRCRILDGPVSRGGHCRAWAAASAEPA